MSLLIILVLLAGSCYGDSRIVGGNEISIDYYPSIVQVEFREPWGATWSQTCGGSILNEMFVLSAAHCFEGDLYSPSQRRIRAGSTYRNEGGVVKNVVREYNHPDYGVAATFDADITVVRLASFLTFTPVIQQTRIMVQGSQVPDNSPVIHAGWGDTIPDVESSSPVLRDVVIYTINNNFCRQRYLEASDPDLIVTPNMICAGVLGVGGRDACQGDTGGPLYYGNILVGVASWGNSCADPYYPGVSTAVSAFTNWIIETAV